HVLGYLKFSAKGTKSKVFGMPIPDSLITAKIQQATYYREYLSKATKTSNKPAKAKRIKRSISRKTRQPRSSPKSVGASEAEEVPAEEPQVADEDADYQKAVEESMKDAYALPKGLLPPVVIREPESGEYQPLLEVPGKGKTNVTKEQVTHDLLSLQKHKKTSPTDQYIFQRRVFEPTRSSGHDESPYALLGQSDNEEESKKVMLRAEEGGQDKDADKNAETEVESMVNVTIQQALSSISLMTSPIIDLTSRPESPKEHQQLKATTTDTTTTTTTTLPPPQAPQQSTIEAMMMKHIVELEHIMAVSEVVTNVVDWAMQAPLRNHFRDLPEADMKEILHQRMWESNSYKSHEDHMQLFEALEKSMNRDHYKELVQDLAEACNKRKKSHEQSKTPPRSPSHQPPPPPLPAGPSGALGALRASGLAQMPPSPPPPSSTNQESSSKGSATPSPSKTAALAEYQAWTTTDIRLSPSISLTLAYLEMDEDMSPDEQVQSSDDEDIGSAHIPTVNLRQGWWKCFEEELPTTSEPAWSIRSSDVPVLTNNWASALASYYSPPPKDSLLAQTGDITTFMDWFHKRRGITELKPQDLKGRRPALSISKMKATYYLNVGLEKMVPDQLWIKEECKYDIAAMYAQSGHTCESSVLYELKFFMYRYDYMKKIVLCRADLNEHVIAERDFKYLYPSDFEDLNLLNLQGHLNHLPPKDNKILTTAVNQWTRQLVIR
nr:hypothetical protein [Tanacetum cinerariifolium]